MSGKKIAVLLLAVSLITALAAMAEERHAAAAKGQAPVLTLTPKLRAALVAEMAGVKAGVAEISVSLASGEWEKTAQRALLIRDSYIMKQKLSPAELEQLERSLPAQDPAAWAAALGHGRFSEKALLRMARASGIGLICLGLAHGIHLAWQLARQYGADAVVTFRAAVEAAAAAAEPAAAEPAAAADAAEPAVEAGA